MANDEVAGAVELISLGVTRDQKALQVMPLNAQTTRVIHHFLSHE